MAHRAFFSLRRPLVRLVLAVAFLVPALATAHSVSGHAAGLTPQQKQLQKILARRHYWEQRLKSAQHQEWVVQQQLTTTHTRLTRQQIRLHHEHSYAQAVQEKLLQTINSDELQVQSIQGQLQTTRAQYRRVHKQAHRLLVRLRRLRARIKRESGNVARALVQMYQLSQVSPLETVLESNSLTSFMNQQDLVDQIGSHDAGVLNWARREHVLVHAEAAKYLAKMAELKSLGAQEATQLRLVVVEAEHENLMLIRARRAFGHRQQSMRRLESSIRDLAAQEKAQIQSSALTAQDSQKAILQNQQSAERVAWIIGQETGVYPNIGGAPGALQWPLVGPLTQGFGPSPYAFEPAVTYHGVFYAHFHTGVDIAAPFETPIHAAGAGRVIFAGLFVPGAIHASYGLCVIIMHSSSLSTLYAHMDITLGLKVHVGQIVSAGQVIGYEGVTGNTTGPHLHFEVRVNGDWVNPLFYLPPEPIA